MRSVAYGQQKIDYNVEVKEGLKSHYISVARAEGVVLKGEAVSPAIADQLVLKKARWILEKLELVRAIDLGDIVTGSRVPYLGRRFYVELIAVTDEAIKINFTASKFKVYVPISKHNQADLQAAFADFMRSKAKEKIAPRVRRLSKETGLAYKELKFIKLEKRWGSCTPSNNIIINTDAVKLPYPLIDYLIIHELVHTRVKNHSKAFWSLLSKYAPNWRVLDERMQGMKL